MVYSPIFLALPTVSPHTSSLSVEQKSVSSYLYNSSPLLHTDAPPSLIRVRAAKIESFVLFLEL